MSAPRTVEAMEAGPLLLDANGAAALVGIGRSNLFRLLSEGSFPSPVALGKRRLWRRAELEAWTCAGCPPSCRWTWPQRKSENRA